MAKSPFTERADKPSTLLAELERLTGHDTVLRLVLRNSALHTGKLAEGYIGLNWWGEEPEVIEPEEQRVIDLLKEYDASLKA